MNACTAQNVRRISSMLKTVQVRMRRTRLQYIPSRRRRRRRRLSSSRCVRSASISNSIVVVHDGLGSRPTREGASGEAEGRGKVGDDVMTTRGVMKMLRGDGASNSRSRGREFDPRPWLRLRTYDSGQVVHTRVPWRRQSSLLYGVVNLGTFAFTWRCSEDCSCEVNRTRWVFRARSPECWVLPPICSLAFAAVLRW